jgi:hypothetical protein
MSKLNIMEINRIINEKKQKRYEIFEKILAMCNTRLKLAAEQESLRTFLVIPEFIIGKPSFSMTECLEYVIQALKKNGFLVRYYFPKMLYVSWDFDEIKQEKKPLAPIQIEKPKALLTSNITTNKNGKLSLKF